MKFPSPFRHSLLFSIALAAGVMAAHGQSFLFDFGAAGTTTTNGPSPDDPLNFWNNITDSIGTNSSGQLLNLVTTTNFISDVDFLMVARFNGSNTNGTTDSTLFPDDATRDSLFGNTETFSGLTNIFPVFKLASLDPALTYDFTFYASRTGVGDNRETLYTVTGAEADAVALNPANNIDSFVTLSDVSPNAAGEITIALTPGPANNNTANHFTYIGVLRMDTVPEPSTAMLALLGGAGWLARRRRTARG